MLSPAKRFGKLRLFAVPLLAASALALFAALSLIHIYKLYFFRINCAKNVDLRVEMV